MVIAIFIVSTISFLMVVSYFISHEQKVKRRVERFVSMNQNNNVQLDSGKSLVKKQASFKSIIEFISNYIKASDQKSSKIESELQTADIPLRVEEFITIKLISSIIAVLISFMLGIPIYLYIVMAVLGWKLPSIYVKRKRKKRIEMSAKQLPQVLETMTNALKSGFSFMQALQLVSSEIPEPLGKEFKQTIKEINLGITMEKAFDNLLVRLPNKDIEIMVTAVLIQRTTGGNLAQILETIQETITERVRMKDELRALTAQGRMSALVITLLPVALGLVLSVMNPNYFVPLFTHPLGLVLSFVGIFSGILGWVFIMKIVTIEV